MDFSQFDSLINLALQEDLGSGDVSSLSCIAPTTSGSAKMLVKEDGVIAGLELAKYIFLQFDSTIDIQLLAKDGDRVKAGTVVMEATGNSRSLLMTERTVLNFVQRLSGVATATSVYADALKPFKTKVLDTRKTTPGWRKLEKWAVKAGGGENHRMGLYDMVMLKDNHIDQGGGITEAVNKTRAYFASIGTTLPIEVEVRNMEELEEVLSIAPPINRVMLDNFSPAQTALAVQRIGGKVETESSGGITLQNLIDYAQAGVDFISVGALTHSVKGLDISLKIK